MPEDYNLDRGMKIGCDIEDVDDLTHKMYNHRLLFRCFVPIKGVGYKVVKTDEISIPSNVAKMDIKGAFGIPHEITIKMTKNSVCSIITKDMDDQYPYTTIHTTMRCI